MILLCVCRNADTLKRLQDTEKLQKEQTEAAYVNLDISNEEKEKGNQVRLLVCLLFLCMWLSQVRSLAILLRPLMYYSQHAVLQSLCVWESLKMK